MVIRPAGYADIPALRVMFRDLTAEQETAFGPLYPHMDAEELDRFTLSLARQLDQNPECFGFVAADDNGLLGGFLLGEIQSRVIGKPHRYASVHWLYVVPPWRASGVGRALTLAACGWGVAQGIDVAECSMASGDTQWLERGWRPYMLRVWAPTQGIIEHAERRPEPAPPAPPPVVVVKRKRGRPRKIRPAGNGATHANA